MTTLLKHASFTNIQLCPWRIVRPGGLAYFKGGIAYPSRLPAFARHYRGNRIADLDVDAIENADFLSGSYIFGGCYHEHFGHFVAEFAHRLWICQTAENKDKPVLFMAQKADFQIQPFFTELMDLFGIQNWKILHRPTDVEHLIIAEQGSHLNAVTTASYLPYLERITSALSDPTCPKKICILRGHMPNARLLLEGPLEQALINEGYEAIRPEELSLERQLKLLYNADHVVISEGSALHLFDLLPALKAKVAVLNRRPNKTLANTTLEGKAASFTVFDSAAAVFVPMDGAARNPNKALAYAPFEELVSFLRSNSFLSQAIDVPKDTHSQDFTNFLAENMPDFDGTHDTTIRLLLSELARRFKMNRSLNMENTYLKARAAIDAGDLETAKRHVQQYAWLNPDSTETADLRTLLETLE